MTKEEAIEIIEDAFDAWYSEFCTGNNDWSREYEARDMAISALKQESLKEIRHKIGKLFEGCYLAEDINERIEGEHYAY